MSRNYNQEYRDTETRRYAYDFDYVLRHYIMRSLAPFEVAGSALELGCFEGAMTEKFAAKFDDLTVIEASDELIEQARKKVPASVTFINSTFETADPGRKFDNIFLIHTLEHLDDAPSILRRIAGWLSERGRLFIVVPNADAPSRQIAVAMGLITHNAAVTPAEFQHGHRITYSFDTLTRDAAAGGLQIEHRGGIFFKPLANFQFDRLLRTDIIDDAYLEGCYTLGMRYPELCASIFLVARTVPRG